MAWHPLGWRAAWLAEIEPFPSAVLAHHHPETPNLGDMTTIAKRVLLGEVEAPDVLTGGTPCQAFSVAGLRQSLADERGNLTLKFVELLDAIDHVRGMRGREPAIAIWENVPGVLSTKDNAFGCFLAGLAGEDEPLVAPGGKWANAGAVLGPKRAVAWRTLDAQYFGLAQRRRRVFVVASARNGFDPAEVLFEWQGLRRDLAPSREAGQTVARGAGHGAAYGGNRTSGARDVASALSAHGGTGRHDFETETFVTHSLRGEGFDASEGGTGRGAPLVPVVGVDGFNAALTGQVAATMGTRGSSETASGPQVMVPVAFPANLSGTQHASTENLAPSMGAKNPTAVAIRTAQTGSNGWGINTEGTAYTLDSAQQAVAAWTTKLHNTGSNNAGKLFEERTTCLDANSPPPALLTAMQVRRLTPRECERLQGFPDDYTAIPWRGKPADQCPDGPRYKALGNSWAVPVARWVGLRVARHLTNLSVDP